MSHQTYFHILQEEKREGFVYVNTGKKIDIDIFDAVKNKSRKVNKYRDIYTTFLFPL